MMDNETILKLFKKFAGDHLNIYGLLVTPVKVEPSFKTFRGTDLTNIYFKVTNPNEVSYFSPIVENYIYDETEDFESFVNEKIEVYFVPSFKTGFYLNDELKSKIQKVFDSVKVIEFTLGTPFIGYERYKLFIKSVGVTTGYWDNDSLYIMNNVKVVSAEKDGEWQDPELVVREYTEVFLPDKESYWETENLYSKIDQILNEYPLLTDQYRNISSYYDTKFVG
jgi:hypothetical protein